MPNFNTAQFVEEAIQSVLNQSYKNFELIIVDDGSIDNSVKIISNFDDERIVFLPLTSNQGPQFVRNLALSKAKGRYIAFLDSDDMWEKDKLQQQIKYMEDNNILLSYTPYFVINENGHKSGVFYPRKMLDYHQLLLSCDIGNSTAIYDSKTLGKIQSGSMRHDYELWLKILKQGYLAQCIGDTPLASIRIRKGSDTSNKLKSAILQWKVYREIEKLSFFQSLFYQCNYIFYGFSKRLSYFGLRK